MFLPEKVPQTGEPSGLQSMGSQRVGHSKAPEHSRWLRWWPLWSFVGFTTSTHSSSSGSSSFIFLCRNILCFILCEYQELPLPLPAWSEHGIQARPIWDSDLIPEQRQKTKAVVAETIAAPWKDSIGFCCLDSQSCLFTILSRPDSSTAPSIYWIAPFVSNRCMLCQGFCSLVCLLAAEKSSLTPRFVLVRENSKASLQTVEDSPIGKKASALFYIVSSCTYPQQRYSKADFNFCTFRDWVHFVHH